MFLNSLYAHTECIAPEFKGGLQFYFAVDEGLMNKKVPLFEFEVPRCRKRKALDLDLPGEQAC